MVYYLNESFPIRHVTLWADSNHGILKQNVPSPNPELIHIPLVAKTKDLSTVSVDEVLNAATKKTLPILLAGGQGTRLGINNPKGLFSIADKTLFQWLCEKIPKNSPVAIMTSPLNHEEILRYFERNGFFGLEVHFFKQEIAPLLDLEKRPTNQEGPNGNGSVFRSFIKSGLAKTFRNKGFDSVVVSYIDNPLSDPLDPLVEKEGKIKIVEYPEAADSKYVYSGQLAFQFSFFCKMGEIDLPIHWVRKNEFWKGEKFIFDVFEYAKKVQTYCVPRKTHYAPIKAKDHVERVQNLLRQL
jgi:UDP-N-acetylglucosamine/UDP-N-acetylgalactosamine diphosphorylase